MHKSTLHAIIYPGTRRPCYTPKEMGQAKAIIRQNRKIKRAKKADARQLRLFD